MAISNVFVDGEVSPKIVSLINEAKSYVVLISPYLSLWRHVSMAIEQAVKRGVQVVLLVRNDPEVVQGPDVKTLRAIGVRLFKVDGLHAKVYMNEFTVIVSSMNMTQSSTQNSFEIAIALSNEEDAARVRSYVRDSLMRIAVPLGQARHEEQQAPRAEGPVAGFLRKVFTSIGMVGTCIRCGDPIPLNDEKPLCDDCYREWAAWANPEYRERYCHSCGEPSPVTYARPLCRPCYRR